MKNLFFLFLSLLVPVITKGQTLVPGNYDGIMLAYDTATKKITGYFEAYNDWDEQTKIPRFSCVFYFEGVLTAGKAEVKTYYPGDKGEDIIPGVLRLVNSKEIALKLSDDHGGCWNILSFKDEPASFSLRERYEWSQVKYLAVDKAYFYEYSRGYTKRKAYLVKGDFVCIEKIEGTRAFCVYHGKKITKGWLDLSVLNK